MSDALARMWTKFLPEIENRMALLEAASAELRAGALTDAVREAGHAAAHKLAGVLGTFGLPRGTELARMAELLLAEDVPASATTELEGWLAELKILIDGRK